ncbi:hypothetical protein FB45DRAFT_859230 [Roridomyces roridus]|uniref:C2H2-type domain-containing protein n=2 Tax=Roridomyces roridus TaxID=1738132 RepID=A0AAD7CLZ8_9AGAR|nr:hypothetical protein FB45DRAFT_859230 [Roridomyces roridus]
MAGQRRRFTPASFKCTVCGKSCRSAGGLTQHRNAAHPEPPRLPDVTNGQPADNSDEPDLSPPPTRSPSPDIPQSPPPEPTVPPAQRGTVIERHPILDGTPCDHDGYDLPAGAPPPPWDERAPDDFSPFESRAEFELAEFLYTKEEMSTKSVDRLAQLLAALYPDRDPPFADYKDLYATIDAIQQGDIPWESFSVQYTGPLPENGPAPVWMTETFEVWYRSPLAIFEKQLANPDFKDEMDWAPKRIFKDSKRQFTDLFSGNWVWDQAVSVFGSDKTTVSVGTGNTEFYPFYGGIGNIYNSTRRAHQEGLSVMAFLSIPKTTRQYAASKEFRKFRRQLFHSSIARILQPLKPHMTTPRVTRCADGHFRRAIYGLGPYIADYPEQALLTCIVQGNCARYVYLPAIAGLVPNEIVQTVAHLTEFCHLVRRSVLDEDTLLVIDTTVARFHAAREIFRLIRPEGFSLPRQHSIVHYRELIQAFGAPNGLCSSITESKHIKAVKRPYRRSNRNKPLSQILLTNQRLDKIMAARVDFTARGMMDGSLFAGPPIPAPPPDANEEQVDDGVVEGPTCLGEVTLAKRHVRGVSRNVHDVALHVDQPRLHELIRRFLFEQLHPDRDAPATMAECPPFAENVFIYNSARAVFYAPSDVCGIGGMRHERIRAVKSWYSGPSRYDCVFIEHDGDADGFRGLHAARVHLLFRFKYRGVDYPCALIHWFSAHGNEPDPDTGMWIVKPDWVRGRPRDPSLAVVSLRTIFRAAHLIGMAGKEFVPADELFNSSHSLDAFKVFYINKYADHHAHEIAF